jgi:integrase
MLADAVRQGLIVVNPAARADLPPTQDFTGKEIPVTHTVAIRRALLELAPNDPFRNEPDHVYVYFFDVALGTGLRLGELRALRWSDVDRERRLIRIERAYSRKHLRRPKTESGIRSVPLFPSVNTALREVAARAVERGRYAPDELVFGSMRAGHRFSRRTSGNASGALRCGSPGSRARVTASTTCATRAFRVSLRPAPTSSSSRPSPVTPTR